METEDLARLFLRIRDQNRLGRFYHLEDKDFIPADELWRRGFLVWVEDSVSLTPEGAELLQHPNHLKVRRGELSRDYFLCYKR